MWRDLFMFDQYFEKFDLAPEVTAALKKCKCIAYAETKEELYAIFDEIGRKFFGL